MDRKFFQFSGRLRGSTAANTAPTAHEQVLGSVIGCFDIRCTLEGRRSQWEPKWCLDDDLRGALYFQLQFASRKPHVALLETATVRIRFGSHVNSEPVPRVFTYAPINGISGPPMTHSHEKHSEIDPEIGVEAPGGGASLRGIQKRKGMESTSTRSWQFTSGKPSPADDNTTVTDVEFNWIRGWKDDFDGLNRKFRAAVVITRDDINRDDINHEAIKNLAMSVSVEARGKQPWYKPRTPKERRSRPLRTVDNTNTGAFEELLNNLQSRVEADNSARLQPGKLSLIGFEYCRR